MNEYGVFLLAFAASAAAPGPEITALLARALSGGMYASLPLALGILCGKLLMLSAALAGLAALMPVLGPLFIVLKLGGIAWLGWLGIRKWRSAGRLPAHGAAAAAPGTLAEIGLGLAMTLSNPMALMFYLALLPGVIDVSGITLKRHALLCLIIAGVMAVVTLGYGLAAETARKLFSASHAKAHIDRITAAMMIAAAVLIAMR